MTHEHLAFRTYPSLYPEPSLWPVRLRWLAIGVGIAVMVML